MFLSWQLTNRLVDEVYYTFTGQHTYDYKFQIGASPLSETWEFASGLVLYLVVVFGLREYVKSTKAMPLKGPFAVHNLLLTIASLVLLLLIGEVMIPLVLEHGFFWSFCSHASFHESGLQFAYYLNYLSKYWELIDTVFLVLQKKPLRFLHVYHHSLTMVLCIAQLRGEVALQWVPIFLNVIVHVIMYFYYFLCAIGVRKIWWKRHVTTSQIVQFVIDLVVCYYCTAIAYLHRSETSWYTGSDCQGDITAAYWGCFLLSSYLVLFVQFFYETYVSRSVDRKTLSAVQDLESGPKHD